MGTRYHHWNALNERLPKSLKEISEIMLENRAFTQLSSLDFGDHGLEAIADRLTQAIQSNKRIALYADYDVDGTMSCVSWIWFFRHIGFSNFTHYIPCRFQEGYGVNLKAVQHLIENEGAELIITMDTGITANDEANYCKSKGVDFICTDHHKIQPENMPDCLILNPKLHPDEAYQELCGCGVTFVLLRKMAVNFPVSPELWTDLLALAGMATICDVVPLNPVNHKLARLGVGALMKSRRPVLRKLCESHVGSFDEKDVGFRVGPRINAVGRLGHANLVIDTFVNEHPSALIEEMGRANEQRKRIQERIIHEAMERAAKVTDPIIFLGGDWHRGVVGIAASRIAETFWKPTWLFEQKEDGCKGSARSIPGFDVTEAMGSAKDLFSKYGGHRAAGGFSFDFSQRQAIRERLCEFALKKRKEKPELWTSSMSYDCELPSALAGLDLTDLLDGLKPFGHGFEEPRFLIRVPVRGVQFLKDKKTGERKHTVVVAAMQNRGSQRILLFNGVYEELQGATEATFLVSARRNTFRGEVSLSLEAHDFEIH